MNSTEKVRKLKAEYREKGLCVECGEPRSTESKSRCQKHLEFARAAYQRNRAKNIENAKRYMCKNIANGLCKVCPQPRAPGSKWHCLKHLEQVRSKYQRKTTGKRGRPPIPREVPQPQPENNNGNRS